MTSRFLPSLAIAAFAAITAFPVPAHAATLDELVANADSIALVQADTASEHPAPNGKLRVRVKEILKGVNTAQTLLVPASALKPGPAALVLFPYQSPVDSEPALRTSRYSPPSPRVWPLGDKDSLSPPGIQTNLDAVKKAIASLAPEEVDLNAQVIDALLVEPKRRLRPKMSPARADYISLIIAMRDLDRDRNAIKALLESPDENVRKAAESRLRTMNDAPPAPRWPTAIPKSLKAPADNFSEALIGALQDNNAAAFVKAFPAWLDSGVMRDRQLKAAEPLDPKLAAACNLSGAPGKKFSPPAAPRLPQDFAFDKKIPAQDRMKAIALLAQYWNYDRLIAERAKAIAEIQTAKPTDENVRRAAFWEPRDEEIPITIGSTALRKLPSDTAPESVELLKALFFMSPDRETSGAAKMAIQANNKAFVDALLECVKNGHDKAASRAARQLSQEGRAEVVPLMLAWLQDKDPETRQKGALNLCWIPKPESVAPLLKAVAVEKDKDARELLLVALAQTGDPRGFDLLLAAAAAPNEDEPYIRAEMIRGLSRIGNPKALPVLARAAIEIAQTYASAPKPTKREEEIMQAQREILLNDAVQAFGKVSKLYPANEPDELWNNSGYNAQEIKDGLAKIQKWSSDHGSQ